MSDSNESYPKLLSLAVHEFRTPASVISGYLRMLQRDTESPLNSRQKKMVEEADRSCARIVAILAELSEIGKLDAGALKITRQPLELFSLVGEVAAGVHEGKDREVVLEARGPSQGVDILGDPTRLKNAFDAIFRAILREAPANATVVAERRLDVESRVPEAAVVVALSDSVQTTYEAAHAPFDEKRGGLGLALPLARRVIEAHGGRLVAPVDPSGEGETRTVRSAAVIIFPLGSPVMESRP